MSFKSVPCSTNIYLFVYGSLKSGFNNPFAQALGQEAILLGKATAQGRLLNIAWYPGLIEDKKSKVLGELYYVRKPHRIMPLLHMYEGVNEGFVLPEYYFSSIRVKHKNRHFDAYTYYYQSPKSMANMPLKCLGNNVSKTGVFRGA